MSDHPPDLTRLAADLRRSEDQRQLLVRLSQLVNSTLELRQVFGRAARELHRLTAARRVTLLLLEGTDRAHGYALEFAARPRWFDLATTTLESAVRVQVVERRLPLATTDSLQLPLVCRERVVGLLGLVGQDSDHWNVPLLTELCTLLALAVDNAAAYQQIAQLTARLQRENVYLRDELKTERAGLDLIGTSPAWQRVRQAIAQVAPTASTALILGETGTGKELIARAIHDLSPRRDRLLVKVNCAALAPGVLASELFGHEAGAFTGAGRRRLGRFELAHQGTIFLDEIAEVPAETQVLLLRVLQERTIERVGGNVAVPVDVRVVAATHRDLPAAVQAGTFRADLFYRLNVFPLQVPPLRERRDDLPLLLDHFVQHFNRRLNRSVTSIAPDTLRLLAAYPWPGNVRELENLIERAMIVATGATLHIDQSWLVPVLRAPTASGSLAEQERSSILAALARSDGKIYGPDGAAAALGLKPTTLYGKMRKLAIHKHAGSRFE